MCNSDFELGSIVAYPPTYPLSPEDLLTFTLLLELESIVQINEGGEMNEAQRREDARDVVRCTRAAISSHSSVDGRCESLTCFTCFSACVLAPLHTSSSSSSYPKASSRSCRRRLFACIAVVVMWACTSQVQQQR